MNRRGTKKNSASTKLIPNERKQIEKSYFSLMESKRKGR